ncbi:hypothetical protein DPMN_132712 [Dreissena polymorpha]|uniref:Uncharacterized protein n=1 Tax=Dreissena polymorpha TaxID=45954 RepID=A0A9D4JE35_DREPO|nr:hypothetical protein DPMN_132712 [Dreissena polymorpha]
MADNHPFIDRNVALKQNHQYYYQWSKFAHLRGEKCPAPGSNVFQPRGIIFELVQDIKGLNLLTKFYEDRTVNVASRVHITKNAPSLGSHVFQAKKYIFELIQDIIETNLF